jgi:O-antigen/teichoic acid export membrane protein
MDGGPDRGISASLSYQYVSAILFEVFGAVFYIVITKTLPTSEVGIITLILAVSSLLNIAFSFGFPVSAQHFISYFKGKKDEAEMKGITKRMTLIGGGLSILAVAFSFLVAKPLAALFLHNTADYIYIYLASFYIGAGIIFGILHGVALGHQLFKADAVIYLSSASFSYLIGLVFLLFFHNIEYIFVGFGISYFYGSIIYTVLLTTRDKAVKEISEKTSMSLIFAYSWPIILSSFIGYGSQYVDRFVVAYFLDVSTLGIYSFALILSSSLAFFAGPLVNVLIPKLSEYFSINDRSKLARGVNLSSTLMVLIYSPLSLGLASIAPIVLSLLAKSVYSTGTTALMILVGVSSFFLMWNIFSSVIYAIRKTKVYILSTSVTLASNVILSFLLIPKMGMIGAAIANSSVNIFSFIVTYYFAIIKETIKYDWVTILKIWFSSFIMFIFVLAERILIGNTLQMLPFYIFSGGFVYFVLLNLIKSLKRYDKDDFLSYMPDKFDVRKMARILLSRAF